jgi:hypothetical protein
MVWDRGSGTAWGEAVPLPGGKGADMRVILIAAIALLAVSCRDAVGPEVREGTPPPTPTTVVLHVGEHVIIGNVEVTFIRVASDSRCPVDVTCVWTGNAAVELSVGPVIGEAPLYPLTLNTDVDPREADAWGLHVALVDLEPKLRSSDRIDPRGYVVTLTLTPKR